MAESVSTDFGGEGEGGDISDLKTGSGSFYHRAEST